MSTNPTVHPYEGDNALWCHLGKHDYDNGTCTWCGRRDRTQELPTVNN